MNVAVCMAHDQGYSELAAISAPTIANYCQRWGYHFYHDAARDPTEGDFMKIAMYQELLPRYGLDDVFVWIDTDALVMNPEIRLDHIIYHHMPPSVHFLIGCDPNGMNSGVFFTRFTPEGYRYTEAARVASKSMGWSDQPGMIQTALNFPYNTYVKQVPGKIFNCFLYDELGWPAAGGNYLNRYEEGDFIVHFAGLPQSRRIDLARAMAR